ncbi:Acyl carrier protein phosphodiesterase [Galbibacter marinus]|uniref:Acyl carrier protein phosphodiesterase n=1 Tax=Galbibacter marinus TaxID=555500 RepID=K2PT50_9FLAO|nr:acyl carrier protein phosphodiesterase [Galbibacter marinus]EKF54749.1 Acyl carrier protein phosphodiesterase [Galbibacter marinus]
MNFLAHIYLSGDNPKVKVGNFMADSIRGKRYEDYPQDYKNGILLHRAIDTFTDAHPTVRKSTKKLHANYSHYSGVIVDIFYDHFLAKNWQDYCKQPLDIYVEEFYDLLQEHYPILPMNIKRMMPYLIADNWLLSYAKIEGISKVLNGMNRRTQNRSKMNYATEDLQEHYSEFESEFTSFFEELKTFSSEQLQKLTRHNPNSPLEI